MELECTSNILEFRENLRKRKQGSPEFLISCENRMPYAVAVDQGSTRVMKGLTNSVEDREAASDARHAKHGSPKWEGKGLEVTRGEDWTTIVTPPAGIMVQSVRPIRELVTGMVRSQGLTKAAAWDIARGMETILAGNTPVDESLLRGAWKGTVR